MGDEDMPATDANVKKLSPTEPKLTIRALIEVYQSYPLSKTEKILRSRHAFKTSIINPHMLEARITMPLRLLNELLERFRKALEDIIGGLRSICIEYYLSSKKTCKCLEYRDKVLKSIRTSDRIICLISMNDKSAYIYCNLKKRLETIRFPQTTLEETIDLIQLTKTIFMKCYSSDELNINEIINNIKSNIELYQKSIIGDERPIHGPR
jgi:hypothetical protein